jgi:hypothetical protein
MYDSAGFAFLYGRMWPQVYLFLAGYPHPSRQHFPLPYGVHEEAPLTDTALSTQYVCIKLLTFRSSAFMVFWGQLSLFPFVWYFYRPVLRFGYNSTRFGTGMSG